MSFAGAMSTFDIVSTFVPVICFTVGSTLVALLSTNEILRNLITFNNSLETSREMSQKTRKLLCSIVQDFSETKQFSENYLGFDYRNSIVIWYTHLFVLLSGLLLISTKSQYSI